MLVCKFFLLFLVSLYCTLLLESIAVVHPCHPNCNVLPWSSATAAAADTAWINWFVPNCDSSQLSQLVESQISNFSEKERENSQWWQYFSQEHLIWLVLRISVSDGGEAVDCSYARGHTSADKWALLFSCLPGSAFLLQLQLQLFFANLYTVRRVNEGRRCPTLHPSQSGYHTSGHPIWWILLHGYKVPRLSSLIYSKSVKMKVHFSKSTAAFGLRGCLIR